MLRHTTIIAEAGVNYNGDINLAKKMIEAAAEARADIVKFQTGIPENVISKFAEKAEYQKTNTKDIFGSESQLDMVRKLMLPWDVYPELIEHCKRNGISFLSTPFDIDSAEFLHSLGVRTWKIPSGEITNYPLLKHIAEYKENMILSTGMCTLEEVNEAIKVLLANNSEEKLTLLQCNTEYPTPYEDANINAMITLLNRFHLNIGYSDHTKGIEVPIAAVALGATVIEKHFTLDRNMDGPDQIVSIEPYELKEMITSIRNIEKALGNGIKIPSESERKNIKIARKSIVAITDIRKGDIFTENNISCKRPGDGMSPMKWDLIIGKTATRCYRADEKIDKNEIGDDSVTSDYFL